MIEAYDISNESYDIGHEFKQNLAKIANTGHSLEDVKAWIPPPKVIWQPPPLPRDVPTNDE